MKRSPQNENGAERPGWFAVPKAAHDRIKHYYDGGAETVTCQAVFEAFCRIANDKGMLTFKTDQPYIAMLAGCTPKTVRARLADLEEMGLLSCERSALRGPITYSVTALASIPPFGNKNPTLANDFLTLGNERKRPSFPTTEECTEEQQNNITKKARGPEPSAELIEEVYRAYPKHVGKNAARKAIAKVLKERSYEEILAKTKDYTAAVSEWPDDERKYIPHPATFFNKGHYDDDPAEWVRSAKSEQNPPNPSDELPLAQ